MCHSAGSAYKQVFSTTLATYCLPLFLHPSVLLAFGAPNPGRRHIACIQRRGGGRLGGLPLALEGWRCRPQRMGMAKARLRPTRRRPGVSAAEMDGC